MVEVAGNALGWRKAQALWAAREPDVKRLRPRAACQIYFCAMTGLYDIPFWLPTLIAKLGSKDILEVSLLTAIPLQHSGGRYDRCRAQSRSHWRQS
jgi:hypothetical protein